MAKTLQEIDDAIRAEPDFYKLSVFRGAAKYEFFETPTLEAARIKAREVHTTKPVGIYAVKGESAAHVENYPDLPLYESAKDRAKREKKNAKAR